MAARPRKYNLNIPNLYFKLDKRTNKIYWQYKHPGNGKFIGFGTDEKTARAAAIEVNRIMAEQALNQTNVLIDLAIKQTTQKEPSIRVKGWVEKYAQIQHQRVKAGEIKEITMNQKLERANVLARRLGPAFLNQVDTRAIAAILDEYLDMGKSRMAQQLRSVWSEVFKEAQHAGEVPPGYDPAQATRQPFHRIKRARLSLEDWKKIYKKAAEVSSYAPNAMLLAIVTGQRRADIVNMKFSDIWDGHLHIEQSKRGRKIAIPLTLRCEALGITLDDVVRKCRDRIVSKWLIHHTVAHSGTKPGDCVDEQSLSRTFREARTMAGITCPKGKTLPGFHEQRSLSERVYRDQGINTQKLLGHKRASQTDQYNDDRGLDWVTLVI
jgi:integrase